MKKGLAFLFLVLPTVSLATCSVQDVLETIRPGASWSLSGQDYSTLVWQSAQSIPTKAEVTQAILDCQTAAASRLTLKQQARLDVKNNLLTQAQRLQALLILLDLD